MSTKKIEGYGNEATESWSANHPTGSRATWLPATLIIHSGEREPVYTQSEVVTMLKEMEDAVECVDVGSYVFCGVPSDKLNAIAAKHGIVLDPL